MISDPEYSNPMRKSSVNAFDYDQSENHDEKDVRTKDPTRNSKSFAENQIISLYQKDHVNDFDEDEEFFVKKYSMTSISNRP